jgi:hypothetical protein
LTNQLAEWGDFRDAEDLSVFYEVADVLNPMIIRHFEALKIKKAVSVILNLGIESVSSHHYYPGDDSFYMGGERGKTYDLSSAYSISFLRSKNEQNISLDKNTGRVLMEQGYDYLDTRPLISAKGGVPPDRRIPSHYTANFHPFEPITITFPRNYGVLGYDKGQTIKVPAYMALLINKSIADSNFDKNVRVITNSLQIAAAIASVPFTGGSSLVVATTFLTRVGGAVALADNFMKDRETLSKEEYAAHKHYYEAWDTFYMAVGLAELGVGGTLAVTRLPNAVRRLNAIRSWKRFHKLCKKMT